MWLKPAPNVRLKLPWGSGRTRQVAALRRAPCPSTDWLGVVKRDWVLLKLVDFLGHLLKGLAGDQDLKVGRINFLKVDNIFRRGRGGVVLGTCDHRQQDQLDVRDLQLLADLKRQAPAAVSMPDIAFKMQTGT